MSSNSNIEITIALNKLIEQQNQLYAEQAKITKNQMTMLRQMVNILKNVDVKKNLGGWNELNETIEDIKENLDTLSETGQQNLGSLNEVLETGNEQFYNIGINLKSFGKGLIALSGPMAVLKTFKNILSVISNAATGLTNIILSVGEAIFNVGVAIITAPFKMLSNLMSLVGQGSSELRQALEDVRKQFGDLNTGASKAIIDMSRNMKGHLAETGLSVYRIFGNLAERIRTISEYATQLGAMFNNLRNSLVANAEAVGAYIKGLGLTESGLKGIGRLALSTGTSFTEVGRQITSMTYGMGEAFDINGKEISRAVGEMINDVKNFGSLSIKQLTSIAVFANKLGLEFQELLGVIDQFDNFENAANAAAQLSQAFGLNVDALEMIKEQDPAARFEQLRKAFFQTGRSVENMTRQELRLLSAQTGLSEEAVKLGFSLANQGVSYADIQKQADLTQKKQLTQAEAMQKLANSIERLVKSGHELKNSFFEIFMDGFFRGILISQEFRALMRSLAQSMRITFNAGRALGQIFVDIFPGVKDIFKNLTNIFEPSSWKKMMNQIVNAFSQFFKDVTENPESGLKNLFKKIQEIFFDRFSEKSSAGRKLIEGFSNFFKTLFKVGVAAIKISLETIRDILVNGFKGDLGRNEIFRSISAIFSEIGATIASVPWGELLRDVKEQLQAYFIDIVNSIDWNAVTDNIFHFIGIVGEMLYKFIAEIFSKHTSEAFLFVFGIAAWQAIKFAFVNILLPEITTWLTATALPAISTWFSTTLIPTITSGLATIGSTIMGGLATIGSALTATAAAWPIIIALGLAAIIASAIIWGDDLLQWITDTVGNLGTKIAEGIEEYGPMILEKLLEIGIYTVDFFLNLPDRIGGLLEWLAESIENGFEWVVDGIKNIFNSESSGSSGLMKAINVFFYKIGQALGRVLTKFVQKHFPELWQQITGIIQNIFSLDLENMINYILNPILEWKSHYIDPVINWFNILTDSITAKFSSIVDALPEPIQRLVGLFANAWQLIADTLQPVVLRIKGFLDPIIENVKGFWDTIKNISIGTFASSAVGHLEQQKKELSQQTEAARAAASRKTLENTKLEENDSGWSIFNLFDSRNQQKALSEQMKAAKAVIQEPSENKSEGILESLFGSRARKFDTNEIANVSGDSELGLGNPNLIKGSSILEGISSLHVPNPTQVKKMERNISFLKDRYTKTIANDIRDLVSAVNAVTADLQSINDSPETINVQLKKLADNLKVGGSRKLEIKNKNFTINMQVNVVIEADEFEQALASRPGGSIFVLRPDIEL